MQKYNLRRVVIQKLLVQNVQKLQIFALLSTISPPISILYYGGYPELVIKGGFLEGIIIVG